MTAFLNLIGGVRNLIIALGAVLVLGWAYKQHHDVAKAQAERDKAILLRDMAATERDKAIAAAKANQTTIDMLKQEKSDINEALNALVSAQDVNHGKTQTREIIIQNQAGVPANAAVAAPVLIEIIGEVQDDRIQRRGAK